MYYPRLRDLREDNDMSQKQVAAYLGIDQRVYNNYETGKRELPSRFLSPLAELYGTSVDYILGRTDTAAPYPPRTRTKYPIKKGMTTSCPFICHSLSVRSYSLYIESILPYISLFPRASLKVTVFSLPLCLSCCIFSSAAV